MSLWRTAANLEILLPKIDDVPAATLCSQQHRKSGVLFRLDGLNRIHHDAEQPPGLAHYTFLAFCVRVRSFTKKRNATITRFLSNASAAFAVR